MKSSASVSLNSQLAIASVTVGNTTITLDKVSREHESLVRRAEAIVRESK